MLTSLHVENFRGFRSLSVEGLGRVNVIIGRNDSGKTSLMGAAAFARNAEELPIGARTLGHLQIDLTDFESAFRPLFHGGDTTRPIRFVADLATGGRQTFEVAASGTSRNGGFPIQIRGSGPKSGESFVGLEAGAIVCPTLWAGSSWWSGPYPDTEGDAAFALAQAYRSGTLDHVVSTVRGLFEHIEHIDLVGASIYTRLRGHPLPLPVSVLGDGARRVLDFALGVQAKGPIYVDEIENGLHWSVLRHVWRLLRTEAPDQVFATTHREEAIRLACDEFVEAGDDGLRVIRIDRFESEHRAVVYSARQALAALDADLEIRG